MLGIITYLSCSFFPIFTLGNPSVPLFLWSGKKYFGDNNERHPEGNRLMQDIIDEIQILADSSTDVQRPEAILTFIFPDLDSTEVARQSGAYSSTSTSLSAFFLKDALTKSKSSLVVPHVLVEPSAVPISVQLEDVFSSLTPKRKKLLLKGDNFNDCQASWKQLNDFNQEIFSNSIPDLIMVKVSEFGDVQRDCMKSILDRVNILTSGNFVAMLTGNMPKTNIIKSFHRISQSSSSRIMLERKQINRVFMEDNAYSGVQFITANILMGLFVGAFIVVVMLCGISCLISIETPQRLSTRPYHIGKQT